MSSLVYQEPGDMDKVEVNRQSGRYPSTDPSNQARQRARERARHIRWVSYTLLGMMTLDEAARALQIENTTLDRIKRDLLGDGQQDTDDLRKMSHARKQCRKSANNAKLI